MIEYLELKQEFMVIFNDYKNRLDIDSVGHVQHYVNVAELELAYESFILSLREASIDLLSQDAIALVKMGISLELNKDSVFQFDFWKENFPWMNKFVSMK